ncbi:MAG: M23 family metallopeptidase [Clostridia bacterium]|nr:M23 family metallopeptidase [Clostridia bacterium]
MKYEKKKKNSIFEGKSFYLIIALSLLAIGAASWMAYDRVQNDTYPTPNSSITENNSSEMTVPPIIENDKTPTNPVDTEKDDVPYQNNESKNSETSSETAPEKPTATNFVLPLMGNVSKNFSSDTLIYSKTYNDMRPHNGIDIIAEENAVIKSCGNGVVTAIVEDIKLGKYIEIDHGNNITAKYCGFDTIYVKEGDSVDAITKLGTIGTVPEECLDERHIHLEFFKEGISTDPLLVIYPK